ncbi:MAG: hypothetical protein E6G97_18250 [Alphaproteobacteria bacterium]|nr:MAG: hypothetical protein E6G97_18250 [Alphaproteobacteria bacterium]
MILESHNRMESPVRINATRLVIKDNQGRPLAVFFQVSQEHVRFISAGEPDFERHLESLGLDRTVVLTNKDVASLVPPRIRT